MGCGSSTQGGGQGNQAPVLAMEVEEKPAVPVIENVVDIETIPSTSCEIHSEGMTVVLSRVNGAVVCTVDDEVRNDNVVRMLYDPYWSFLRFPDTGKGGRIPKDRNLPQILGKLKGVVQGTACRAWIPDSIQLDLDIPAQLQRGQIVKALDDVHVGEGTLAVMRGTHGTVMGVINPTGPPIPNVVGSGMRRINVRWDRREDGKTKKISVLEEESRLTSDMPELFLRGSKVLRLEDKDMITPFSGVIIGPPQQPQGAPAVRIYWDESKAEQDCLCSDLHIVTFNDKAKK